MEKKIKINKNTLGPKAVLSQWGPIHEWQLNIKH